MISSGHNPRTYGEGGSAPMETLNEEEEEGGRLSHDHDADAVSSLPLSCWGTDF